MSPESVRFDYDSYPKNGLSSNFGCNHLGGKKIVKVFPCCFFVSMLFFCEHYNSCIKILGRLKACEIFSCVKFIFEKSKSMVFIKAAAA